MAFVKVILILQIIFIYKLNFNCAFLQSMTRVGRFDVCQCSENCVLRNFESQLRHPDRANTVMFFKFNLIQDVPKIKLVVFPVRCKDREALDSCEALSKSIADKACAIFSLGNTMWTSFVNSFTPPFKCPFNKGTYVSENSSLDADMYKILPLKGWYYKTRIEFHNGTGKNLLWTFCLEFTLKNVIM